MPEEPPVKCEFHSDSLFVRADLTIAADVKAISPAVQQIMGIVRQMECAAGNEFEIETSIREALANAIIHGNGFEDAKSIFLRCYGGPDAAMLIIVRDQGDFWAAGSEIDREDVLGGAH